ncbi:MAG: hypothetical protein ACREOI_32075 [bacterium]
MNWWAILTCPFPDVWDATNDRGERVASGVYVYELKAGTFVSQKKLMLMK